METFITHKSALQYWRLHGRAQERDGYRRVSKRPPSCVPSFDAILKSEGFGLPMPLDIMANAPNGRRASQAIRPHLFRGTFPIGSFISVGNGLFVSSPELCFFQMASELPLIKLIELGFELCGSYSLPGTGASGVNVEISGKGFYDRPPLTTAKKLDSFIARMSGAHGRNLAIKALRYITDGAASPMETILVMLLSLPYKYGGYGLPMPELNSHIIPLKSAKRSSSKSYYSCDLYWPELNLAAEYDSDQFHTGGDRIANDSKRRNALAAIGVVVITITNQQIRSIVEFEKAARSLAINMDRQLRYKNPGFAVAQRGLRSLLL